MSNKNTIERQIIPDLPKVIDNEQISVYVPIASSNKPGVVKLNVNDFIIDENGITSLKYPYKDLVKFANPLELPSLIKLLKTEFEHTLNDNDSLYSEVKLKRSQLDAHVKPELIMLDELQFEKHDYDADMLALDPNYNGNTNYYYYKIAHRNPYLTQTIMRIDVNQFDYNIEQGDNALLKIKYPYVKQDGTTSYSSITPTGGFGLVKPVLDWFKINETDGSLQFNKDYLIQFTQSETNPVVPEILPIYGAVRDLQQWENKDLFYKEDLMSRPQAVRDVDNIVTGKTPSNRIRIELTKESIGLNKVANKAFSDWTYSDLGNDIKQTLDIQFNSKLSYSEWANKFGDYDSDLTPNQWLKELEGKVTSIDTNIKLHLAYRGVYDTPSQLPMDVIQGQYANVLSTNTIWYVNESNQWVNSNTDSKVWQNEMETSSLSYLPDGIASAGSSGKWSQSNHIHPTDITRQSKEDFDRTILRINNLFTGKISQFNSALPDIVKDITIPFVPEGMYIHNWQGQSVFEPATSNATKDNYSGKFVKVWLGTKQELANDFGGIIPDDVMVNITDDFVYSEDNIFTREQTETLVNEMINNKMTEKFALNGATIPNVKYVLETYVEGGETILVPFAIDSAEFVKSTLSSSGEGLLTEDVLHNIFYTINNKRPLTIPSVGTTREIGLSNETSNTAVTLTYKGNELLTKPITTPTSVFVYKQNGFASLTRDNINTIYASDTNPMILPARTLASPPVDTSLTEQTYSSLSSMILGVDIRQANKMPITKSTEGTAANSLFLAERSGKWLELVRSTVLNKGVTLIPTTDNDPAGSLGHAFRTIEQLAIKSGVNKEAAIYSTSNLGYNSYAADDINIDIGQSWENLLTPQVGPSIKNRRGDAIITRRIGLTSTNSPGNNRSSFNMRTIICRDKDHRDTIYNTMGVNSDRDNILFMWPEQEV